MLPLSYHERFAEAVSALPELTGGKYEKSQLLCERLHLFSENGLDVYYAPFHHLERSARVVLIGLTPGFTQMEEAFRAAKTGSRAGLTGADLFSFIDRTGSFSGPMRSNLVRMLDGIGLNKWLGIGTCFDMFAEGAGTVHFTSAVSAPIFKAGLNYNGSLIRFPALRRWILDFLAQELATVSPEAVFIPLGKGASEAVALLTQQGLIRPNRCLVGFPHPSGANGHAKRIFEAGRRDWRSQIEAF